MSEITAKQLSELHKQADAGRVTCENLQAFLRNPDSVFADGFSVTVDYAKSLAEMIAEGSYDWNNSDITSEHFPTKKSGVETVKLELVCLEKSASTDEAPAGAACRRWSPWLRCCSVGRARRSPWRRHL